jgi:predicted enzyme related to lactoylglutathione lyase
MGERTQHPPGQFCWTDLTTTDPDAAKAFYVGLFGWDVEDMPMPGGGAYSMARIDGKYVAAIAPQPPQQREAGVPPMWNNYVAVESADEAAQRAEQLGATVHAPAFDVMEAGRMAVVQDPQGAFFMLWQARQHIGAALVNAPGALSWNELASPDVEGSKGFYGELFGWTFDSLEGGPGPYFVIRNGERSNGGIRQLQEPGVPPHWLAYFGADDADAALAKAQELGGGKLVDPLDIPNGRIAVARDPQGAAFALYAGQFED